MNSQESLIKRILSTEAKYIIGLIVFILGAVAPYYQIQQDIALIKQQQVITETNHLTHLQNSYQDLNDRVNSMAVDIAEIKGLLKTK